MPTFTKQERLCSKKTFEQLLKKNTSLVVHPFKIIWASQLDGGNKFPIQMAISVPKRKFKRAVDRNRIKRMIRECYRKNKNLLYDYCLLKNKYYNLMFIYIAPTEFSYTEMEHKIIIALNRLIEKFSLD